MSSVASEQQDTRPTLTEVRAAWWTEWRTPLLIGIGLVVGARALLSVWAALVLANFPTTDLQSQYAHVGIPLQSGTLAAPWQREDALWYEKIATLGYDPNDGTTAFL